MIAVLGAKQLAKDFVGMHEVLNWEAMEGNGGSKAQRIERVGEEKCGREREGEREASTYL